MPIKKIGSTKVSSHCKVILSCNTTCVLFSSGGIEIVGFSLVEMKEIYKIKPKWRVQNVASDANNIYGYFVTKEERMVVEAIDIATGNIQWSTTINDLELYSSPDAKLQVSDKELMICFNKQAVLFDKIEGTIKQSKTSTSDSYGLLYAGGSFYVRENKELYKVDSELNYELVTPNSIRYIASSPNDNYIYYKEKEAFVQLNSVTGDQKKIAYDPYSAIASTMDIHPAPNTPHRVILTLENDNVAALLNFETETVEWVNESGSFMGMDALFTKMGLVISLWSMNQGDAYRMYSIETGEELYRFPLLGPPHLQGQRFTIWEEKLIEIGGEEINIYEMTSD